MDKSFLHILCHLYVGINVRMYVCMGRHVRIICINIPRPNTWFHPKYTENFQSSWMHDNNALVQYKELAQLGIEVLAVIPSQPRANAKRTTKYYAHVGQAVSMQGNTAVPTRSHYIYNTALKIPIR